MIISIWVNKKKFLQPYLSLHHESGLICTMRNADVTGSLTHFVGFTLAMFPVGNPMSSDAFTFVVSPMEMLLNASCFTFRYYLRNNLKVYISNSSTITTLTDLQVDGGFDFHQGFIDLIPGNHQIIWEVQWDQSLVEVVRNYRAAIGDLRIIPGHCAGFRKLI